MNDTRQAKIGLEEAIQKLQSQEKDYMEYYTRGSLRIGLYEPHKVDLQKPHEQDELYVIANGHGRFIADGRENDFKTGDVLFVAAGVEHKFSSFSDDFKAWVFFYGKQGGEST